MIQLSVVIPTCARNQELMLCLERLGSGRQEGMTLVPAGVEPPGEGFANYEVIVTDDGSTATAEAMIRERFPWARWVQGPGRGPAANRNHGARQARGQWLAFTDDDCLPDRGWLGAFARAIQSRLANEQVLEGRTEATAERPHPLAQCPVNKTGGHLWSCNFAIDHDVFRRLGGFDEQFPYAAFEDMDFQIRLGKHGVVHRFLPEALVRHPWKEVRFLAHMRKQVWSQLILRRLHPEQRQWVSLGMHFRRVASFYVREFPRGLQRYGWRQLTSLPVQLSAQVQTTAIFVLSALGGGPPVRRRERRTGTRESRT